MRYSQPIMFIDFLQRLYDGEDIDEDAFIEWFQEVHKVLLLGIDGKTYYFPTK